jgi:hypothetical protein
MNPLFLLGRALESPKIELYSPNNGVTMVKNFLVKILKR